VYSIDRLQKRILKLEVRALEMAVHGADTIRALADLRGLRDLVARRKADRGIGDQADELMKNYDVGVLFPRYVQK
jgi:hypothetical protein